MATFKTIARRRRTARGSHPTAPVVEITSTPNNGDPTPLPPVGHQTPPAVLPRSFITEQQLQKELLPMSRRGLLGARKDGRLPFVKFGHRVFYHRESVEKVLLRLQQNMA
jgi:hypothetical protein